MNNTAAHQELVNALLLAFGSRIDCRVWKQVTGVFRDLNSNRIMRVGLNGCADLSGITMGGRRLEIEAKTGQAQQNESQKTFQAMIERYAGIYILARSVEQAIKEFDEKISR
jgi:hypothetical protein